MTHGRAEENQKGVKSGKEEPLHTTIPPQASRHLTGGSGRDGGKEGLESRKEAEVLG